MKQEEQENINERLTKYSDRQIVVECLEILNDKQLRELIKKLERNY